MLKPTRIHRKPGEGVYGSESMNRDQEIQFEGKEGHNITLAMGELHSLLLADFQ